ncbi:MAG: type II toxin-antitoxin system prevent-host-death family antitoxin [Acaryochloris sp. RU_4_1]|nr:type II toxin-antitoxin system prevent-host-death family antitoxin [Acaryochloris sp. RU_4_1]NJR55485.1 type II toxin-antitoxin system prevent-host-death family antitoxin [Acaryochloris sp. CRU_2_0]
MKTVGTYEAKTHLSELLEQVQLGETVVITKHGTPVARIMPYALEKAQTVGQVIAGLQSLRQQLSLKGLSIRAMIEEGRRF